MDKNKEPGIGFESISLVEEIFHREKKVPKVLNISLKLESRIYNIEKQYFNELSVFVKGSDEEGNEALKLEFMFVGRFSTLEGSENMEIDKFMQENSSALMYPYIREHISLITQKAGVAPVLLPPMNVQAALKRNESNKLNAQKDLEAK